VVDDSHSKVYDPLPPVGAVPEMGVGILPEQIVWFTPMELLAMAGTTVISTVSE
jgi:hypothetical protein